MPVSCGEVGTGWFAVQLRDAVAAAGHYSSPAAAAKFFGQLADEISASCASGKLSCGAPLLAEVHNKTNVRDRLFGVPLMIRKSLILILRHDPVLDASPSRGDEPLFMTSLRFLNAPQHTHSLDIPIRYWLDGWYHKVGDEWFFVALQEPSTGNILLVRSASPDLVTYFNDPNTSLQRFKAYISCFDDCTLLLKTQSGKMVEKRVSELMRTPISFDLGGGQLMVDHAISTNRSTNLTVPQAAARGIRKVALTAAPVIETVVLLFGALAFVLVGIFYRMAIRNICFILALACWTFAASRVVLIVVLNEIWAVFLGSSYLMPTHFLLIGASILSCGAAVQCRAGLRGRAFYSSVSRLDEK